MRSTIFVKPLFGDKIKVIIYDLEKEKAENITEKMYVEALRLQKIFNFFDSESELSILNRKRNLRVSKELLEVLKNALEMSKVTEGKYDVSLGKKIIARKRGEEYEEIKQFSYQDIKIKGNNVLLSNPEVMIDLGSIAKGYITDRLGDFLKEKGVKEFIIDSRGDIIFSGKYNHLIGIQHPRKKGESIFSIRIFDCGVATSGDYMQYHGNFENSHILNSKDAISVTVIAKTLEEADMLSTAIFVVKKEEAEIIMKTYKDASAFVIRKDLTQEYYNEFRRFLI